MQTRRGLNLIEAGGKALLLTATAGDAIHLTREAGPDEVGQPAAPDHYLSDLEEVYDKSALAEPRWAEATLCGRDWILMASEEDEEYAEASFAPTCRRCLALMDKLFPEPDLDDRFPLVVQLVTDTVLEYGTAEIRGVPGDQQAALRREVRTAVRKRTGHKMETYARDSMVIFVCHAIYDQHEEEHARKAAEAMNRGAAVLLAGEPVVPVESPMRLSWSTWATG